jgi:hypothetical protein
MSQFGFSKFDKSAQATALAAPITAGPLTPAAITGWAVFVAANVNNPLTDGAPPGFVGISLGGQYGTAISFLNVPTTAPVSVSYSTASGWVDNLALFGGVSYPLDAGVTNVSLTSNIITVVCSQNFVVGTQVIFENFTGGTVTPLNGLIGTILTQSPTGFTASLVAADILSVSTATGDVLNVPYLQIATLGPSFSSFPQTISLPNPVKAGSTIFIAVINNRVSGVNSTGAISSVSDGVNTYAFANSQGAPFGGYANIAWASDVAAGSPTITVNGSFSGNISTGTIIVVMELPEGEFLSSISGNAGIAGATLTLSGDASTTTTADGSGNYTFSNLANGNYVVTPSLGGLVFTPTSRNVTINNVDVTGVNFTVGDQVSIAEVQIEVTYQNPGNFLYARDVNSWGDGGTFGGNNGTPYSECFVTIGSIELAPLGGAGFPLQHIVGYFDAVGTINNGGPSDPNIFILPNEVSEAAGIGFIELPVVEFEPPVGQTHPSKTILARRWPINMMNSYLASQFIHHVQVKISWDPENAPNTVKGIAFKEEQS